MIFQDIRAAIYAPVSSDGQARRRTIDSQLECLLQRVHHDGLELEADLRFIDDGYRGSTLVRPALERLRDLAAFGAFERLYVHAPGSVGKMLQAAKRRITRLIDAYEDGLMAKSEFGLIRQKRTETG